MKRLVNFSLKYEPNRFPFYRWVPTFVFFSQVRINSMLHYLNHIRKEASPVQEVEYFVFPGLHRVHCQCHVMLLWLFKSATCHLPVICVPSQKLCETTLNVLKSDQLIISYCPWASSWAAGRRRRLPARPWRCPDAPSAPPSPCGRWCGSYRPSLSPGTQSEKNFTDEEKPLTTSVYWVSHQCIVL